MRYLQDLGLKIDEPAMLCLHTELGAPSIGEFSRSGFLEGWGRLK